MKELKEIPTENKLIQGVLKFGIDQCEDTVKHDCYSVDEPVITPFEEYKVHMIEDAERSIKYHEEQLEKTKERSTDFIKDLKGYFKFVEENL